MATEKTPAAIVLDTAIAIANFAPRKRGANVYAAQIPWSMIEELRSGLDALGQEWRT